MKKKCSRINTWVWKSGLPSVSQNKKPIVIHFWSNYDTLFLLCLIQWIVVDMNLVFYNYGRDDRHVSLYFVFVFQSDDRNTEECMHCVVTLQKCCRVFSVSRQRQLGQHIQYTTWCYHSQSFRYSHHKSILETI